MVRQIPKSRQVPSPFQQIRRIMAPVVVGEKHEQEKRISRWPLWRFWHWPAPAGLRLKTPADEDIKLFRKDLRSLRKQIIAANISLSDREAEQFWPLFDRYTQELVAKQDRKCALLKEYAGNYTTMTDDQAEKYVLGRADVDEAILQVRLKYFPLFRKVLAGKSSALFFQLDWRLGLIMDLQLASQTPLIEP